MQHGQTYNTTDDDIKQLQPSGDREATWTENKDFGSDDEQAARDQVNKRRHQRRLQERQREWQRKRQRHRPRRSITELEFDYGPSPKNDLELWKNVNNSELWNTKKIQRTDQDGLELWKKNPWTKFVQCTIYHVWFCIIMCNLYCLLFFLLRSSFNPQFCSFVFFTLLIYFYSSSLYVIFNEFVNIL